jgi:hypothetical protein
MQRSKLFIFLFFLLYAFLSKGQVTSHSTLINFQQSNDTDTIVLNGLLDGKNTFTYPNYKAFEPMENIKIINKSTTKIHNPRITFNSKKNWYDINELTAECFSEAVTPKEKALSLWKFVRNNTLHGVESEYGSETFDPVKLLGTYGYGLCYHRNYSNTFISQGIQANARSYSLRGLHFVSEIDFGDGYMLIDSDVETFYLKSDNTTIASYEDIYTDKNLLRRSHHYGKNVQYNYENNESFGYKMYGVRKQPYYFGNYQDFHSLDYTLRPNESIEYSWLPGQYYHSFETTHNVDSVDIANGKFTYATNFINANLNELIDTALNCQTYLLDSQKPNIHTDSSAISAKFVLKITSPFVIVNSTVKADFYQQTLGDSILIYFSKDSVTWTPVWQSTQTDNFTDSVNLYNQIATLTSTAIYFYYLKFNLIPQNGNLSCGIDSLAVVTDFQVSRFFLPALKLGNNVINYTDSDTSGTNIDLNIVWKESVENNPPQQITTPIFPVDGGFVDSLRFTFYWNQSVDDDSIVDYEFQLSDRLDMKYPLMPSFEVYTSKLNNGQDLNRFSIPLDGMLNSGTIYYWRVKAKDSRGAWSDWSPVWSFIPTGPMPPTNGASYINNDTALIINWTKNSSGSAPLYYEIHSSNEWLGFSASSQTLFDTTSADSLIIPLDCNTPNTFYRIIAVDSNYSKSGVSDVIQVLYPQVYICPDTIVVNQAYHFSLFTNQLYVNDIAVVNSYFQNVVIPDTIECQVLSKPDWLTFSDNALMGTPTYQDIYPDGPTDTVISVQVQFSGKYSCITNVQTIKIPVKPFDDITLNLLDSDNNLSQQMITHPNPFIDNITIDYKVDQFSNVDLSVFNVYGQKVASLINQGIDAGVHQILWDASQSNSGVYFLVMNVLNKNGEAETFSKRITKLK